MGLEGSNQFLKAHLGSVLPVLALAILLPPSIVAQSKSAPMKRPVYAASTNDVLFKLGYQKHLVSTGVGAAWKVGENDCRNIVVAVLDTGVDSEHEDLRDNMYRDGKGNVIGYNAINPAKAPKDGHYHGTAVAGVIGAVGNNRMGISGVCQQASIMPIKVLDDSGAGSILTVVKGIAWATKNGAKVLNNSYSTLMAVNSKEYGVHPYLIDAFAAASKSGVLAVVSAGNEGRELSISKKYWAAKNMIYVGALDDSNKRAKFSNYSSNFVQLAAPGTNITSTYPKSLYIGGLNGTSFSAPFVTGSLALVWGANAKAWSSKSGGHLKLKDAFIAAQSSDPFLDSKVSNVTLKGRFLSLWSMMKLF